MTNYIKSFSLATDTMAQTLSPKGISVAQYNQGDVNTDTLNLTITHNNSVMDLTGASVSVVFSKPDGKIVYQDTTNGVTVTNATQGQLSISLNTQTRAAVGTVVGAVRVTYPNNQILETEKFSFNVEQSLASDQAIASVNDVSGLIGTATLTTNAKDIKGAINEVNANVNSNTAALAASMQAIGVYVESFPLQSGETDDTGRIQRAINSMTSGGVLNFVPYKTYNISSAITSLDNITFNGRKTVINGNGSGTLIKSGNNNHFEGITFQNCQFAINGNGKNNVNINRCQFLNIANCAIYYYGSSASYVLNSYFNNITLASIVIDNNSFNILIQGNEMTNPSVYGGYSSSQTTAHVNCLNGDNIRVIGNKVKNNGGQGILFGYNSTTNLGTTNSIAMGNHCEGNGQEGITNFGGTNKVTSDNIVIGNKAINNRNHQIEVWQADRVVVDGNEVDESNTSGVTGAITLYQTNHSKAVNNTVKNAINNGMAVLAGSTKCIVANNNIFNTNGVNDQSTAIKGHGILLDNMSVSDPQYILVTNNIIESTNGYTSANKAGVYSTSTARNGNRVEDSNMSFGYKDRVSNYAILTTENLGTTAQRPTNVPWNYKYYDTDLKKPITWYGGVWLDSSNVFPNNIGINIAITASSTTFAVAFPTPESNTTYAVQVAPQWNTSWWITGKSTNGFTINFGTAPASASALDWSIKR